MFDPPAHVPLANLTLDAVDTPASRALAREMATKGAVLLRNDGGLLPLGHVARLAVVNALPPPPTVILSLSV
jgi:beta-glucosidase